MAYIEIQEGPYLVLPAEQAFDRGERPINVDASNVVWLDASSTTWIDGRGRPSGAEGARLAFLWGDPGDDAPSGSLVELPAGFSGVLRCHGASVRAVVIQGRPTHRRPGEREARHLEPGSYFGSTGESAHLVSCGPGEGCIIYVRAEGRFDIGAARAER